MNDIEPGFEIPPFVVDAVDPQRMKTMAAILRDPYPVHWDHDATERAGYGRRAVNQGPLNLGYIANMLMAWAGDDSIRRLTVRFGDRVFEGDRVVARGVVETVHDDHVVCAVWLERDGDRLVTGLAEVSWVSARPG